MKTAFKITNGTGFHITFENGWTISVQFGEYHYSDEKSAEVWYWDSYNRSPGDVMPNQTPAEVLALMNEVAAKGPV